MKFEEDYTNSIFRFFYFLFLKEYHFETNENQETFIFFRFSSVLFIECIVFNESWKYESWINPIQDQTSSQRIFKSVNIVID